MQLALLLQARAICSPDPDPHFQAIQHWSFPLHTQSPNAWCLASLLCFICSIFSILSNVYSPLEQNSPRFLENTFTNPHLKNIYVLSCIVFNTRLIGYSIHMCFLCCPIVSKLFESRNSWVPGRANKCSRLTTVYLLC